MTAKIFDPDFGKDGFARHLFRLRFRRLKLSQREFSDRFALSYSVIRDAEQGAKATPSLRLIVAAIARDPAFMAAAATDARCPCTCGDIDPYHSCMGGEGYSCKVVSAPLRAGAREEWI